MSDTAELRGLAGAVLAAERARTEGDASADDAAVASTRHAPEEVLLEVRALDVYYGTRQVLFGIDLTVAGGEVVALLGVNGAGKSTLLGTIAGLRAARRGSIRFAGAELGTTDAPDRVARGIALMPGGRAVFPRLSTLDNLLAGCHPFAWDRDLVAHRVDEALATFPRLAERLDQAAGTLSGGEQQMLGLAKALLLEPTLLLIDELSLGLAPVVVQQLLDVVARLAAAGTTMIIVEQSVNLALAVADRAIWMEKGQARFVGATADLLDRHDLVKQVFLGGG